MSTLAQASHPISIEVSNTSEGFSLEDLKRTLQALRIFLQETRKALEFLVNKFLIVVLVAGILFTMWAVIGLIIYKRAVESGKVREYEKSQTIREAKEKAGAVFTVIRSECANPRNSWFIGIGGEQLVRAALSEWGPKEKEKFHFPQSISGFDSLREGFEKVAAYVDNNDDNSNVTNVTYVFVLLVEGDPKVSGPKNHGALRISSKLSSCFRIIGVGGIGTNSAHCISISTTVESPGGETTLMWKDPEQLERLRHVSFTGDISHFNLLQCLKAGTAIGALSAGCEWWCIQRNMHGVVKLFFNRCVDQTTAYMGLILVSFIIVCGAMGGLHVVGKYWVHNYYTVQELLDRHKNRDE